MRHVMEKNIFVVAWDLCETDHVGDPGKIE